MWWDLPSFYSYALPKDDSFISCKKYISSQFCILKIPFYQLLMIHCYKVFAVSFISCHVDIPYEINKTLTIKCGIPHLTLYIIIIWTYHHKQLNTGKLPHVTDFRKKIQGHFNALSAQVSPFRILTMMPRKHTVLPQYIEEAMTLRWVKEYQVS